jgi:hypothetical protein
MKSDLVDACESPQAKKLAKKDEHRRITEEQAEALLKLPTQRPN